jgi:hypothetical protein
LNCCHSVGKFRPASVAIVIKEAAAESRVLQQLADR